MRVCCACESGDAALVWHQDCSGGARTCLRRDLLFPLVEGGHAPPQRAKTAASPTENSGCRVTVRQPPLTKSFDALPSSLSQNEPSRIATKSHVGSMPNQQLRFWRQSVIELFPEGSSCGSGKTLGVGSSCGARFGICAFLLAASLRSATRGSLPCATLLRILRRP